MENQAKKVSSGQAMLILVISILVIILGIKVVKAPTAIILLFGGIITVIISTIFGIEYSNIQSDIVKTITTMAVPILIVLSVGVLVGAWMISGTVPLMIYYGMKVLSPSLFLVMVCIICTLMSVMAGTSWGTISTVGIAFMGVAVGLGISLPLTAGAVVSGAIFGDKLSPLSDSTVLSAAVCEVNLLEAIKHSFKTTLPAFIVALIMYFVIGLQYKDGVIGGESYDLIMGTLEKTFTLNPLLLIPPVLVLVLIIMKKPTLPVFTIGIIAGGILAMIFQGSSLNQVAGALSNGYTAKTGVAIVDKMLVRGGLNSMLSTVALLIASAIFGAPLRTAGVVDILLEKITNIAKTGKSMMVGVFILHSLFFTITGSYYVTYSVLGQMVRGLFDSYGLKRKNLARILLDTGTGFAPIVPWSVTGVFVATTLGVKTMDFILYAPVTYLSIIISFIYVITGFTIEKSDGKKEI